MKKLFILVAMLIVGIAAHSQNVSGRCYRGYIDAGYSAGVGYYSFERYEFSTYHGFQINPYIFVGGGAAIHMMAPIKIKDEMYTKTDVPVFATVRFNFMRTWVTPFIDCKLGYYTINQTLYLNPSAGIRIAVNRKQAINIAVGYTFEKLEDYGYDNKEAVTVRLGFEF